MELSVFVPPENLRNLTTSNVVPGDWAPVVRPDRAGTRTSDAPVSLPLEVAWPWKRLKNGCGLLLLVIVRARSIISSSSVDISLPSGSSRAAMGSR